MRAVAQDNGCSAGTAPWAFGWWRFCISLTSSYPIYYFRHRIAEDLSGELTGIEFLFLELHLDDGCAVYLNRTEVFRSNLAPGASYSDGTEYNVELPYDTEPLRCLIDHSVLRSGSNANVVAVEVQNHTAGNNDLRFDLKVGYFKNNWRTQ
jgi:hypothetical protein